MAPRMPNAKGAPWQYSPDLAQGFGKAAEDATEALTSNDLLQEAPPLAGWQGDAVEMKAPEAADPAKFFEAKKSSRLAGIAQSFLGRTPTTLYGLKRGLKEGHIENTPAWAAVQDQASDPWTAEQMRVSSANKIQKFYNDYAGMQTRAENENARSVANLSLELLKAGGAKDTIDQQLEIQRKQAGMVQQQKAQSYMDETGRAPSWYSGGESLAPSPVPGGYKTHTANVQDQRLTDSQARLTQSEKRLQQSEERVKRMGAIAEKGLVNPKDSLMKDWELLHRVEEPLKRLIEAARSGKIAKGFTIRIGENVIPISNAPQELIRQMKERAILSDAFTTATQRRTTNQMVALVEKAWPHGFEPSGAAADVAQEGLTHAQRMKTEIEQLHPFWNFHAAGPVAGATNLRSAYLGVEPMPPPPGSSEPVKEKLTPEKALQILQGIK